MTVFFTKGRRLYKKVMMTLVKMQFSVMRVSYCLCFSHVSVTIFLYLSVFMVHQVHSHLESPEEERH